MRLLRTAVLLLLLMQVVLRAEGQPEAIQQAEEALRARDYARAQTLLAPVTGAEGASDYALFLLGNAHYYAKQYPQSAQVYDRLLKDFADSPWRKKALFKKADALAQQKQFGQAADLLQPEVEHLVSDARKEEVAASYLKYAEGYFRPADKDKQPDYEKARSLFEKALELGLTPEKTAQTKLSVARCWYEAGEFGNAAQGLQALLKEHPDAKVLPDAKYYLGRAYLRSGNMRQARNTLRDFQEDYPQSTLLPDVLFALSQTYHVPAPQDDRELDLGVKALREFVQRYGKHQQAIVADYQLGVSYFNRGRYEEAVAELSGFVKRWGKSGKDELPQAANLVGVALAAQKRYPQAIDTWNEFLVKFTNHRLWNQVQRQILDTEYLIGDEAYRAKKYADALKAWDAFRAKYPLDVRNPDIMFMRGMIQHDQKKYPEAIAEWAKLTSKYPETEPAARAWLLTGDAYETKTFEFEKAIEAYGKVGEGQWQAEAQQRLAALKQKKLVLYTERTLTTADEPKLKVVTRNVEALELRGYRVDMVDYFNRLHTLAGVEKLDLALIEPDQKWTLKVPEYAQYKEVETEAPLPFKEPGVYAVTCQADKLEATTVVMVTDL
ncbi:MAG: tetratricopeptide repeat protein, partial [Armatimonadetes bacterium]|nr:tetratricopeptide repeat protein [Armatimonadota bacterium]NCQ29268.1 tetratricopeptide repeat protein [Armatimonadota bacterium]